MFGDAVYTNLTYLKVMCKGRCIGSNDVDVSVDRERFLFRSRDWQLRFVVIEVGRENVIRIKFRIT